MMYFSSKVHDIGLSLFLNISHSVSRFGLDSIPADWVLKVNGIEQVLADIETIVKL